MERREWKYQSQLGVLAGISLCKKYCIIFRVSYPVSKCPATRPKGGELFLYSLLPGNKGM